MLALHLIQSELLLLWVPEELRLSRLDNVAICILAIQYHIPILARAKHPDASAALHRVYSTIGGAYGGGRVGTLMELPVRQRAEVGVLG